MNKTIELKIREDIKSMLKSCTEPQQMLFKRMYSHKNLTVSIEEAVDNMDSTKLDIAFSQVERTLNKNSN